MKEFSRSAKAYILLNIIAGVVLLFYNLPGLDQSNLLMLLVLCALASLALIFKVVGATEGTHYNVAFLFYSFAFFQLGLPEAMVVVLVSNFVEWARHKYPWYIQSFNIGQYLISLAVMNQVVNIITSGFGLAGWVSILAAIIGMMAFTLINHLLVGMVLWFVRQENLTTSGVMKIFPLVLDFTFWSIGASAALIWDIEPIAMILVLIPLYLLYSTLKVPALERKTEVDPKTGLFNAEYFANNLEAELSRANRFDRPITVVMADLDLLRNINNTYGHLAGDEVLIGVANIIRDNVREYDIVSRFGGEEYAILMPETTPEEAFPRIEAIREQIAAFEFIIPTSVTPISASISIGVAGRDRADQAASEIIHNADLALYHAKSEGRNCTYIYSEVGFKDLFESGELPIYGEALTLDQRIRGVIEPFKPSRLRKDPLPLHPDSISRKGPAVYVAGSTSTGSTAVVKMVGPRDRDNTRVGSNDVEEDQSGKVRSHKPAKVHPHWYSAVYTAGITILALLLFSYAMFNNGDTFTTLEWIGLFAFGTLVFFAELFSVDIYVRTTSISTSAAPLIGGTLLFGPIGAILLSIPFALGAMLKHRSPLKRMLFNASNQSIAGLLFLIGLDYVGVYFADLGIITQFGITIMLALFVYLATTTLIALGINLERAVPFRKTWWENFSWLFPYYFAMGVIAFTLILSYQMIGITGLIVIIVPLIVLRYSQSLYIKRTTDSVLRLRKTNWELEISSAEVAKLNDELLQVLSYVIDMRDPFILGHSQQVVSYAVKIAQKLGLPKERIEVIRKGALIHDIGKLGIPESILGKKSSLTPEEYQVVKDHVKIGIEIISKSDALKNTIPMIYHHHEHYDGNGYPDGLKGDEIPLEARILALADSVEAMASDRPYRRGLSVNEIIAEVKRSRGTHFDPQVVDVFLEIVDKMDKPFVVNTAEYIPIRESFVVSKL